MSSASVDKPDMYSSSESMPTLVVVTGVGGAAGAAGAAEATSLFRGETSLSWEEAVASAAFRFLVVGGILAVRWVNEGMTLVDEGMSTSRDEARWFYLWQPSFYSWSWRGGRVLGGRRSGCGVVV